MTGNEGRTRTGIRWRWLYVLQLAFFVFAISSLSVWNFFCHSVEIKRPVILLAASIFALFSFEKGGRFSVIAKIVLIYIIEMFFNQLSGRLVHLRSLSIQLPLIVMAPLVFSFICFRFRESQHTSVDTNDLFKSWGVVFAGIILHLLFLFLLLSKIYGYGYDHNFAILANMCLYFLVFIVSWEPLENICLRRMTAVIFTVFFSIIMVRGL